MLEAELEKLLFKRPVNLDAELELFRKNRFHNDLEFSDFLNRFAIYVSRKFEAGTLSFDEVDDALWAIMYWLDYKAPGTFWKVADFFEKFEVEKNPGEHAKREISSFLSSLAAPGS